MAMEEYKKIIAVLEGSYRKAAIMEVLARIPYPWWSMLVSSIGPIRIAQLHALTTLYHYLKC